MGRVINPNTSGKERNRLLKAIVISIRAMMKSQEPTNASKDQAAFIVLALKAIDKTVEVTVTPWEKRGYWLKADKFRRDWGWVIPIAADLEKAVTELNWVEIGITLMKVGEKLEKIKVSEKHRMGEPWVGAWDEFQSQM